jgi:aryl-alcohol dehydrogenase-like predicted oxidoreductase
MYALGVSEEVTGRALRDYGRMEEIVLASKVYWPMAPGPNRRGLSRKHIVQACEASLKRLGVEAIDLYQIHRFDPNTPIEETLSALDHLVQSGKVRYIGASSGWAWQFARALGTSDLRGWSRFVSMQNHYNLLYREEEREMIPLCASEKIAVLPWSPLARGLLAGTRTTLTDRTATTRAAHDAYAVGLYEGDKDWEIVDATRAIANERNVPMAQVALAWLLSKPAVTAPIIGATKMYQLDEALGAVDLVLSADEITRLEASYRPHAVKGHE